MFERKPDYKEEHDKVSKQLKYANRENERITEYYHNALHEQEKEIALLKHRIGKFLEDEEQSRKAYNKLKAEYDQYRDEVNELTSKQYDKVYKAYEIEKKQNLLLEEKINLLEATITYLQGE